ncbi:MAG: SPOR domain-containing protein [Alphaproteobacteria bacterium]
MFQEFDEKDKSEDFLNDFRNKINQENSETFQERKEEINRSKNILVGALSGIILAGVVGFIAFSPKYKDDVDKELPVIRRPQSAVKVQPLEPGGMQILDQDKSIYDVIDKKVAEEDMPETVLPLTEEPEVPVIVEKKVSVKEIIAEAETPKVEALKEKTVETVELAKEILEPKPEVKKIEEVKVAEVKVVAPKPVVAQKPVVAPKPVKKPAAKIVASVATKGMWQVQIMSSQNKIAIENTKVSLPKKYSPLVGEALEIEEAVIAGKGTFYRLKAGAYTNRSGADKLCADLKKLGLGCFVKQK